MSAADAGTVFLPSPGRGRRRIFWYAPYTESRRQFAQRIDVTLRGDVVASCTGR